MRGTVALAAVATLNAIIIDWNLMLPMRDGIKLHTRVVSKTQKTDPVPLVIDRSPYGASGTELLADIYAGLGDYVAIGQDMRGTQQSEGNFSMWRNDAKDLYDTMEWATKQPWSDGTVYTVGGSADGITQFVDWMEDPPWIKGQFIIIATIDALSTVFPGGAYRQGLISNWLHGTVPKQADGLIYTVKSKNGASDWWDPLNISNVPLTKIKAPAVMWAGWYDIFLEGNLNGYNTYQYLADPSIRGKNYLVVDPFGHCQDADKFFPANVGEIASRKALGVVLSLQLIEGKGTIDNPWENVKHITFYVMGPDPKIAGSGSTGNYWCTLDKWPTYTPTKFFLDAGGKLSSAAPAAASSVKYVYDPKDPVPTLGGNNLELKPCGPVDQRPVENRSDVILHTSDPLAADLFVTGPLKAVLEVTTLTPGVNDTDFTAKLTDVYPDGSSHIIQDGIYRMRWREGNEGGGNFWPTEPKPIVPGEKYTITVDMWNTSYVFNKGHRLRLSVSSSNSERFKANPNLGVPVEIEDNFPSKVVTNQLTYGASHLLLPVVKRLQLPVKILPLLTETTVETRAQERAASTGIPKEEDKMYKLEKTAVKVTKWTVENVMSA
jgi:predicted acyl esterase